MKRFTRKGFRAWMESLAPETTVGHAKSFCRCPLARFLEHLGAARPSVSLGLVAAFGRRWTTPVWAAAFIRRTDMEGFGEPVTAARALEILEKLR